jgi:hypothetical protein
VVVASVTDLAMEALMKEEEHQRNKEKLELEERENEESKRSKFAQDLLDKSPLKEWFPETSWIIEDWDKWFDAPVFRPDPDEFPIRLMIIKDGTIRTVEHGWVNQVWEGYKHPKFILPKTEVWWGPVAKSASDVGKMIRRHGKIMSSMPDHLP